MADLSELAKTLASAADVAQKASAQITELSTKLAELKASLDNAAPHLSAIHEQILSANPDLHKAVTDIEAHPPQPPQEQPPKT